MMESPTDFRRMMLGLPHSTKDYASVTFAAELAELLRLDLVGIFAEDNSLTDLAVLPCVREFQLSGEGWRRLDARQMELSAMHMAAEARRLFGEAVKALRVSARFDLVKGSVDKIVFSQAIAGDILVVIEPRDPAERFTHQFKQLLNAALSDSTSTLFIPSRITRRTGPIVTIAGSRHDQSIKAGLALAKAMQERLIVLAPNHTDELPEALSPADTVRVEKRSMPSRHAGLLEIESLLALTSERLVVLSRGMDGGLAPQLAFERGVPVLLTGSPQS